MSPIRPENRDRYPADWKAISERIRTKRSGGRCECLGECGRGTHVGRCPNRNGGPAYDAEWADVIEAERRAIRRHADRLATFFLGAWRGGR